jgi:ribonuclease R
VRDTPVKPPSGRIAPNVPEHAGNGAAAGPRVRSFAADETPSTRRRGGSKRGASPLAATAKDTGVAKKRGAAPKAARKKR